jgi:hypothetical protein
MPAIVVTSNANVDVWVLLTVKSAAAVVAVAVVVIIDDANVVVVVAVVVVVVAVVPAGGSERPGCGVLVAHELATAHVHIDGTGQIAQLPVSIAVCRLQSDALTIDAGSENVPESRLFCVSRCVKAVLFVKGGIDVKKLSLRCSARSFVKSAKLGTGPVIEL